MQSNEMSYPKLRFVLVVQSLSETMVTDARFCIDLMENARVKNKGGTIRLEEPSGFPQMDDFCCENRIERESVCLYENVSFNNLRETSRTKWITSPISHREESSREKALEEPSGEEVLEETSGAVFEDQSGEVLEEQSGEEVLEEPSGEVLEVPSGRGGPRRSIWRRRSLKSHLGKEVLEEPSRRRRSRRAIWESTP
ncbi:hypothetical protein Hamer_G000497 [Homarus americanus]|uniref:Uncharacterized protein n=1 Tax=Homarus americanus TaxID=6706 RepID=A0A8J5NCS2_HOMAM|nr:hypothetical protein Hamer_G000497 [Homarus americanus]